MNHHLQHDQVDSGLLGLPEKSFSGRELVPLFRDRAGRGSKYMGLKQKKMNVTAGPASPAGPSTLRMSVRGRVQIYMAVTSTMPWSNLILASTAPARAEKLNRVSRVSFQSGRRRLPGCVSETRESRVRVPSH